MSLSEKSATVSLADDGGASTRALAGSLLQYRMENTSICSYKTGISEVEITIVIQLTVVILN